MSLIYVGNVVIDVVLRVAELPVRGGDVLATATAIAVGGGFNVMAAASRQGLHTCYAGAIGTGTNADLARAALLDTEITVIAPGDSALDTGFVITLVDAGGERTFITSVGAEATMTAAQLPVVEAGDFVCLSGYGLLHSSNEAAILPWLGSLPDAVPLVFDPGPLVGDLAPGTLTAVLARTHWLTCNAREATVLCGIEQPAAAARALAAQWFVSRGGVLVRDGAAGCWLAVPGEEALRIGGFDVEAVDLNGAGDAHTGVFIAGLSAGLAPPAAGRRANAAAAIAVTRHGPATAPSPAEIDQLLGAQPLLP